LTSDNKTTTGNFFIDDEVLASVGVVHLEKYNVNMNIKEKDLMPDYFC
jgi:citronellol/citronellal dehydrogenase